MYLLDKMGDEVGHLDEIDVHGYCDVEDLVDMPEFKIKEPEGIHFENTDQVEQHLAVGKAIDFVPKFYADDYFLWPNYDWLAIFSAPILIVAYLIVVLFYITQDLIYRFGSERFGWTVEDKVNAQWSAVKLASYTMYRHIANFLISTVIIVYDIVIGVVLTVVYLLHLTLNELYYAWIGFAWCADIVMQVSNYFNNYYDDLMAFLKQYYRRVLLGLLLSPLYLIYYLWWAF